MFTPQEMLLNFISVLKMMRLFIANIRLFERSAKFTFLRMSPPKVQGKISTGARLFPNRPSMNSDPKSSSNPLKLLRSLRLSHLSLLLMPLLSSWQAGAAVALPSGSADAIRPSTVSAPNAAAPSVNSPATANFVPQLVIDIANQISVTTSPGLPALGHPEKFLPSPDPLAQIHLVLKLSERRVYVYDRDQVKTSFPVAIGRAGWETPTGKYQVIQMQHDPIWQHPFTGELVPPGSDNPLGVRWIGFWTDGTNYIGFHGTPNAESVGRPASHGCVRMYNQDVVKLFDMVEIGTPVEVVP